MIRDSLLTFGTDVDVSQSAGTYNFTDVVDTSVVRDIGQGHPLWLVVVVTGGADGVITGGAAGTIQFQIVSDDSGTISTTTQSVHLQSPAFVTDDAALNDLDQGDVAWCVPLPPETQEPYERYLGLQFVVATTTTTEGTVSAFLTSDPTGWKAYPDAQN